jgi:hypothetical protein
MSGDVGTADQKGTTTAMTPERTDAPPRPTPPSLRKLVPSLAVNLVVPVVGYFLLRPHLPNDTVALALVGAIPVLRTVGVLIWRRRVDPIGVLAAVGFGLAVVLSLLWGGDSLPIKFNEAMLTGTLGLACLISAAFKKPLHLLLVGYMNRGANKQLSPEAARTSLIVTVLIGVTFLLHATSHVILALTLPTGTFLITSRIVGWTIILIGGAVVYWYVHGKKDGSEVTKDEEAGSHRA